MPKFSNISYQEWVLDFIVILEFQEFLVEWFAFWKFTNFPICWKLSKEISILFAPILKVPEFLFEWKAALELISVSVALSSY